MISYTKYQTLRKDLLCITLSEDKIKANQGKKSSNKRKATIEAEKFIFMSRTRIEL